MTTFHTGNPLGSTAVKDLYDNAENLDVAVNGTAPQWVDRRDVTRKSWAGMELEFEQTLAGMGFESTPITYAAGAIVQRATQLVLRSGVYYRVKNLATLPFTLTGTFATDSANLVDVGDASLRAQLVSSSGAGIVGYTNPSTGAVVRTVASKLAETVSITDFGGNGSGALDNTPAFQAAAAASSHVHFPGTTGTVYYFATDPNLGLATISSDPGVVFSSPSLGLYSTIKVDNPIPVNITGSQNFTYTLSPENRKDFSQKSLFLTDGDFDRSQVLPMVASSADFTYSKVNFLTSDTFVDASSEKTTVADQITWPATPADGVARMAFVRIQPGDEISACFLEDTVYRRMAMVQTTAGYYAVYADGGGGQPHYAAKLQGVAAADNVFDYLGRTTHANVAPENSLWSIRVYNRNTFSVLFNGVEVTNLQTVQGNIISAGFGVTSIGSAQSLHINGLVRWQRKPAGGKQSINVLTVGDSLTADIQAGWTYALREALNGTAGTRVLNLVNQAISGDNSSTQLALLQANGTQSANLVFIGIGTNDIQYLSSSTLLRDNVSAMIDICLAAYATPIVWVPQTWYLRTNSGGGGQDTQNNGAGKDHRALLMRLCADRGVKCIDMMEVSGAILSNYLGNANIDPWVRDNIHQTSHANRVMGYALGRAAADALCPRFTKEVPVTPFTVGNLANGWNMSVEQPYYQVNEVGVVSLSGLLSGGTIANGTIMYRLEGNVAPYLNTLRFLCPTNNGSAMVGIIAGVMTIYNATVGTTWVDLSSISYQLR